MARLRILRPRFSLRTLVALVTLGALVSAASIRWHDACEDFARQQAFCNDLVKTLGGDDTIWIDGEVGVFCGTYSRPEGLEFTHEPRPPDWSTMYRRGLRDVTGVSISYAPWNAAPGSPIRAAVLQRLGRLHSLRSVSIDIENVNADDILFLKQLTNVEKIWLDGLDIRSADAAFAILGQLPRLRELDVEFGNQALDLASSTAELEKLASMATARRTGPLAANPIPKEPSDDDEEESDESLDAEDLSEVDLAGHLAAIGLSRKGFADLGRSPSLRTLHLGNAILLDDGWGALASLEKLTISQCRIARSAYSGLAGCRDLVELNLSDSDFSDEGAAAIQTLPKLRKLFLWGPLTDERLASICKQGRITDLSLSNLSQLSEDGFRSLKTSHVEQLFIDLDEDTKLEMLDDLMNVPTLRRLEVSGRDRSFAFLPALCHLTQLKSLVISGTELSPLRLLKMQRALPGAKVEIGYTVRIGDEEPVPDSDEDIRAFSAP